MKFRKKVIVEAIQWFPGMNIPWVKECGMKLPESERIGKIWNKILDRELEVEPGDWIIEAEKGDRYPCKAEIFERTYDMVKDD